MRWRLLPTTVLGSWGAFLIGAALLTALNSACRLVTGAPLYGNSPSGLNAIWAILVGSIFGTASVMCARSWCRNSCKTAAIQTMIVWGLFVALFAIYQSVRFGR